MKLSVKEEKLTALWATIKGKSSWHTCLRPALFQQFHSFIISFYLIAVNPLIPESMLFVVKEWFEGLKYNIDFGGRGWGYTGEVACEQALHLEEIRKSTRASGTWVTPLAASPLARVAGFARPNGELSRMLQGKGVQKGPF